MKSKLDGPVLIVGFGSIGSRHFRNLKALGCKDFVLLRSGKSVLSISEIKKYPVNKDLKNALGYKPALTIIANPTSLHLPFALEAAKAGSHIFLEKPISYDLRGVAELVRIAKAKKLVVGVGFQYRFNLGLRKVKKILEGGGVGKILSAQVHWGEYLPNWHPWEDYRNGYAAKKALGGGVLLTMCHPFDYLRWLVGDVRSVFAQTSKKGGLGIDVEDTADVLLKFKNGASGNVHLNYLERKPTHIAKIFGESGSVYWDNMTGEVVWQDKNGKVRKFRKSKGYERNDMFVSEMKSFLSSIIDGEKPVCNLLDGVEALKVVMAAKKSAVSKRMEKIK